MPRLGGSSYEEVSKVDDCGAEEDCCEYGKRGRLAALRFGKEVTGSELNKEATRYGEQEYRSGLREGPPDCGETAE